MATLVKSEVFAPSKSNSDLAIRSNRDIASPQKYMIDFEKDFLRFIHLLIRNPIVPIPDRFVYGLTISRQDESLAIAYERVLKRAKDKIFGRDVKNLLPAHTFAQAAV
jgi:hypothetical protein